jgi:hypothetical protein
MDAPNWQDELCSPGAVSRAMRIIDTATKTIAVTITAMRGIRPCLVNARHMKNVPGRRTDWHECQWLQFLHSVGLLRAAFRPEQNICAVRTVLRRRSELVTAASQHVQHMHKALTQMNLQIHHVISDITGVTGLAIADAILAGFPSSY